MKNLTVILSTTYHFHRVYHSSF